MIKCDWIFLRQNREKVEVCLEETALPQPGDGKIFSGVGYEVAFIVEGRIMKPDTPLVCAVEYLT